LLRDGKQQASDWGDAVIEQIAKDLTRELGGLKGFSRSNLYNVKQWYSFYATQGICPTTCWTNSLGA
jgi:hypothetical protein